MQLTAYKSNINILGGYRDFDLIPEKIGNGSLKLDERTESSSRRYLKAIQETFLDFKNDELEKLFMAAMSSEKFSLQVKDRILALQFYTVDPLFAQLFSQCFVKIIMSGRAVLTKHDVISYLKDSIENGDLELDWSDETIQTASRKFLTILKKLGYLDGKSKKRVKEIYNGSDFLIFYHYWLRALGDASNVFESDLFDLLLITQEKYVFLMKQTEIRDSLDWQYTGNRFTVEPKLPLNEYVNEL